MFILKWLSWLTSLLSKELEDSHRARKSHSQLFRSRQGRSASLTFARRIYTSPVQRNGRILRFEWGSQCGRDYWEAFFCFRYWIKLAQTWILYHRLWRHLNRRRRMASWPRWRWKRTSDKHVRVWKSSLSLVLKLCLRRLAKFTWEMLFKASFSW